MRPLVHPSPPASGLAPGSPINDNLVTITTDGTPIPGAIPRPISDKAGEMVSVKDFGARGDGVGGGDGAITGSDKTFVSAGSTFTSADEGKLIAISGAGAAGAIHTTTVASVTNATTLELTLSAATTVAGASFTMGTDDSAAIQNAIDESSLSGSFGSFVIGLPAGIFCLGSPLTKDVSGHYGKIKGGNKRSTVIRALTAAASPMLTLGQAVGVHARCEVEGITFDQNNLAPVGLDMTYTRYSTINKNEFIKPTVGGIQLKAGRWVNRIDNNMFDGADAAGDYTGIGLEVPADATNDLQVTRNAFTGMSVGVWFLGEFNDTKITHNDFDNCVDAGIYSNHGGKHIVIANNYLESCGNAAGGSLPMAAVGGGTNNYTAPILLGRDASSSSTIIQNLIVENNFFVSCDADALGVFSGVSGLSWDNNTTDDAETYVNAVQFVEHSTGDASGQNTEILIDQGNIGSQFTDLVLLDGASAENSHCGFQIIERSNPSRDQVHAVTDLVPTDLTDARWTVSAGTVTQTGNLEGTEPIYVFASSADIKIDIAIDSNFSNWLGRYIRVCYLNKGTVGQANGLNFDFLVDTGSGLSIVAGSDRVYNDAWGIGGRNMTLYVPKDTVSLRFRLRQSSGAADAYVANFHIDAASSPVRW